MQNSNSTDVRRRTDLKQSKLRSAITNGTALLDDLDHRSAWARRLKDLIAAQLSDLGGEGAASESEKVLVRRGAMLTLQLELMEQHFALNGGEASAQEIETYQRCTNTLRRTLEALGLDRRAKDVSSDAREMAADAAYVMSQLLSDLPAPLPSATSSGAAAEPERKGCPALAACPEDNAGANP